MKIVCVGRNYPEHVAELGNSRPAEPVVFLKPDTALLRNNAPFYHPDFSTCIHYECELVLRICREGKYIDRAFAHKYYDQVGLGVDFTARDVQDALKAKGLPWEKAKAFDNSAVVSALKPKESLGDMSSVSFSLFVNGEQRQWGRVADMYFSPDEIVAHISQYFTLKTGDLIYTGTPAGVGPVKIGDRLAGFIGDEPMFDFEVK